jgi:hypothetical protein
MDGQKKPKILPLYYYIDNNIPQRTAEQQAQAEPLLLPLFQTIVHFYFFLSQTSLTSIKVLEKYI